MTTTDGSDDASSMQASRLGRLLGPLAAACIVAVVVWRTDVNGWGSVVWLMGAAGLSLIRAPFERRTKHNEIVARPAGSTEQALLTGVALGSGLVPLVHLVTGVLGFADYDLPAWTIAVGAAVQTAALVVFWRSHADLGRNWSVTLELRAEHSLVTTGIYRQIRHPMYTALFMLNLGTPLLIRNWIAGFTGLASFTLLYVVRVSREEAMMQTAFGSAYDAYAARTGRILPRLRRG